MKLATSNDIKVAKFSAIKNDITLSKKVTHIPNVMKNIAVKIGKTIVNGLTIGKYRNLRSFEVSVRDFWNCVFSFFLFSTWVKDSKMSTTPKNKAIVAPTGIKITTM